MPPALPPDPAEQIILALDRPDAATALALADAIPALRWVKVGLELFSAAGPAVVGELRDRGLNVFLDLKFHDIPATMAGPAALNSSRPTFTQRSSGMAATRARAALPSGRSRARMMRSAGSGADAGGMGCRTVGLEGP